jgi:hypothetical protein
MEALDQAFGERLSEIDIYLDLLESVERQIQNGPPRVGPDGPVISTAQQKILYSSVYLQLYNLIEATVSICVEGICDAIAQDDRWHPADLSSELRQEWVRFLARTHEDLNYEKRLVHSLRLCSHLINALPVGSMKISKGGGGNWDDEAIYKFATRLGCALAISDEANQAAKKPFRNEKGALTLVVDRRNGLSHGSLSFVECGDGVTVNELRELKSRVALYLQEVVASFAQFISGHLYLAADRRPAAGGAAG